MKKSTNQDNINNNTGEGFFSKNELIDESRVKSWRIASIFIVVIYCAASKNIGGDHAISK